MRDLKIDDSSFEFSVGSVFFLQKSMLMLFFLSEYKLLLPFEVHYI